MSTATRAARLVPDKHRARPQAMAVRGELCGGSVIHEPSVQRTRAPTAGMKPIIHQTSTADLRAEKRIVKGCQVRDIETIELRLLLAIRHMAREAEGRTPNTARIDALMDERSALPPPTPGESPASK
jgi:hypothetical protein